MPTPQYVDASSGMQKGVGSVESGIAVESVSHSISDPKTLSFDKNGSPDGFCHNYAPSITLTVTGETRDVNAGLCIAQFGTAITFANANNAKLTDPIGSDSTADSAFAGVESTGGFYAESVDFSESRDGFRTLSITAISHPDIA